MTVPGRGGSPRLSHVPSETGVCPVHGKVTFRVHKVGKRANGSQKYRRRCPQCHAERQNQRRKVQ